MVPPGERSNVYDALRLLAAFLVLVSHGWTLLGLEDHDFVWRATRGGFSASWLGLAIFFSLSGFLIDRSAQSSRGWRTFVRKRFLRLWPGLATVVLLTVLVLGPVVTRFSPSTYFAMPSTWFYLACLTIWGMRWKLPGAFSENPYPEVNGSLWTLPYEATLYAFSWLVRSRISRNAFRFGLLALFLLALLAREWVHPRLEALAFRPFLLSLHHLLDFGLFYLAGSCLSRFSDFRRSLWVLLLVGAIAWSLALTEPELRKALDFIVLPLGAVLIGSLPLRPLDRIARFGDFSYGLYIWGFPVQQCLVHFAGAGNLTPTSLAVWGLCLTLPISVASWHLVEKPALARKDRPLRFGRWSL